MSVEHDAIHALLRDEKFRRLANAVAQYKSDLLREILYAETGVNDPRCVPLSFTPHCLRTERVKHRDRPESTGILVGWFQLWQFTVGVHVSPSQAMLWDVQASYDAQQGNTSTLIQDPQVTLNLDPVFKNPLFWYTLALTRSGEKVCPGCLLVRCTCSEARG